MRILDVCTGVGGMGLYIGGTTVLYVEGDPFCRRILEKRMDEGNLDRAEVCSNIRDLKVDTVTQLGVTHLFAGFPCQDISGQGKQRGIVNGTRSSLIQVIVELANAANIPWLFLENVEAILYKKHWVPLFMLLQSNGYDLVWCVVGAHDVGAPHIRNRWFGMCRKRAAGTPDGAKQDWSSLGTLCRAGAFINGWIAASPAHTGSHHTKITWHQPGEELRYRTLRYSIRHWATPVCHQRARAILGAMAFAPHNTLGGQLRFALSTVNRKEYAMRTKKAMMAHPEWVEWLMGFPRGWTNPHQHVEQSAVGMSNRWTTEYEPKERLITYTEHSQRYSCSVNKRAKVLGNACVPACSKLAWDQLQKNITQIPSLSHSVPKPIQTPHVSCFGYTVSPPQLSPPYVQCGLNTASEGGELQAAGISVTKNAEYHHE